MGAIHKISEDFYEISFSLIAMHCNLEDYAMAYELNKSLKSNFKRCTEDLNLKAHISFPIFEWDDTLNEQYWTLISNTSLKERNMAKGDLFQDEPFYTRHYLVPEHKDVDYFLKIENEETETEENLLRSILAMPKVVAAYYVEIDNLKSKNNLIF